MKEWDILCERISSMKRVAVSFSGGIDSTVVLAAAVKVFPNDHVAVFADVPMLSERQRSAAESVAEELGARLVSVKLGWDDLPDIRRNSGDRCYICKRGICSALSRAANGYGCSVCVDGENASDRSDDRPGRKAAEEFGIVSPLKELGMTKDAVKEMFLGLRLRTDIQKDTCMATRIPSGVPFSECDVRFVEECEDIIRKVSGVRQIRMRLRDGNAYLLTSPDSVGLLLSNEKELSEMLLGKGIKNVSVDPAGYKE